MNKETKKASSGKDLKEQKAKAKGSDASKQDDALKKSVASKKDSVAKKGVKAAQVKKESFAFKPSTKDKGGAIIDNKTTFLKPAEVKRRWVILDAKGKPLGRVAALAASVLRGKHRVDFTPNVDCGDSVIIINCKDAVLTGRKLQQKVRYRHSGWVGGLKEEKYSVIMSRYPQKAMTWAVEGMLPHNSLGAKMARRLRTYIDENHGHDAQKPQLFKI